MQCTYGIAPFCVSQRCLHIITGVGKIIRHSHNKQVVTCKTQRGCLEWHIMMATGGWARTCASVSALLGDNASLRTMGFASFETPIGVNDCEYDDEMLAASTLFNLIVNTLAVDIDDARYYSEGLPMKFCALLFHTEEHKVHCLQYMRDLFEHVGDIEALAQSGDQWARSFLSDLLWVHNGWCKEILIGGWECEWASVPKPALDEIRALACGLATTKGCEDVLNGQRQQERAHRASKLGRVSRWHKAMLSGVLEDSDRRPLAQAELETNAVKSDLPNTLFEASQCEWSMGEAAEKEFKAGPTSWSSPRPEFAHLAQHASRAMLSLGGDVAMLRLCWFSMLAQPGTVIMNSAHPSQVGLVLSASRWGVIVLLVSPKQRCGMKFVVLPETYEQFKWEQFQITNPDDWQCLVLEAVPPAVQASRIAANAGSVSVGLGIVLTNRFDRPSTLMRHVAQCAFPRMTMVELRRLYAHLKLPAKPKPKTEHELVKALVKALCPGITDAEFAAIMEKRGAKPESPFHTPITTEDLADLEGTMDEDALKALRKTVVDHEQRVRQTRMRSAAAAKASSAPSSSSGRQTRAVARSSRGHPVAEHAGPRAPREKQVENTQQYTEADLSPMLPQVPGCTLVRDGSLHMRWSVRYPNPSAPFSTSKVWDETTSERDAALLCLKWAWRCHAQLTGESCGWDLDSL